MNPSSTLAILVGLLGFTLGVWQCLEAIVRIIEALSL